MWNEKCQVTIKWVKRNGFPPDCACDEFSDTLFDVYCLVLMTTDSAIWLALNLQQFCCLCFTRSVYMAMCCHINFLFCSLQILLSGKWRILVQNLWGPFKREGLLTQAIDISQLYVYCIMWLHSHQVQELTTNIWRQNNREHSRAYFSERWKQTLGTAASVGTCIKGHWSWDSL